MNNQYKFRCVLIFLFFCTLYGIIILNLYLIQIHQHNFFTELGEKQYMVSVKQYHQRAPIYDRNHNLLAMNKECLSAFILPKSLKNADATTLFLQQHFPHAYDKLLTHADKKFIFIARKLTPQQLELITTAGLTDIKLLNEPSRYYPVLCASQIVGMTDIDNQGLFGLELQYNEQLMGKPEEHCLEKDARSGHFYFKRETQNIGKDGAPLVVTIDSNLQFLAYDELKKAVKEYGAQEGSVLIMNPKNGDILAMVSYPGVKQSELDSHNFEHAKPKVVTDAYELGSVMKVLAALAVLEEKVVTPDETINCHNTKTTYLDGRKINTWAPHGLITFSEVIEKSNNIGIAKIAKRIGTKLYDHYRAVGFGSKTGLDFPGEQIGFVNPPSQWSKQSIISLSYGYEVSATLLQLALPFCMIANGGYPVKPRLVLPKNDAHDNLLLPAIYSKESIETIKTILENTTVHGTAKRAGIKGYRIMSKTGTANLLVNSVYEPTKNIFTCVGIIERGDYQRVIVTFIKETTMKNAFASTIASPLFEHIAEKTLIHDKIV